MSPKEAVRPGGPGQADFLAGDGQCATLIRSFDWGQTPLGDVRKWPQSLRTSVSICLNSRFAILVWWGKDLVMIYNDAYVPIIGTKHPHALGSRGKELWPEIWHIIGPMLEGVLERGGATWSDNLLLELERNGYPEECYFTFSYSPIHDESGGIGGVFTPVHEKTREVIGERRLRTLRDLASTARASNARTMEEACRIALKTIESNPHDIPFALLYLMDDGQGARLSGLAGIAAGHLLAPEFVADGAAPESWVFLDAVRSGVFSIVELSPGTEPIPCGAWPVPPEQAVVLPLLPNGVHAGFLIAGVSPRKRLDDDYRTFFEMAAGHISTAIAEAQAGDDQRKRAESLAELDRAKTAFFSNVSHEFRTPLTLMLGPLEEMLVRPADPIMAPRQQIELVQRNGIRLLNLVNSLLDFSRLEAHRIQCNFEPVWLSEYTRELAELFRSVMERAGLRLVVDCDSFDEPACVDRDMWEKIVLNLLSNAFKFTFAGEIRVALRRVGDGRFGDGVELSVSDTGTGVPERELPHLFERFHRVEGALGRTNEGTGIGLALIQELVNLHGGSVSVRSVYGQGSTFSVLVPLRDDHLRGSQVAAKGASDLNGTRAGAYVQEALRWLPEEDGAQGSRSARKQPGKVRDLSEKPRPAVLLADDNADMRDYVRGLLEGTYEVTVAADGQVALDLAVSSPPDLVLSDTMMPSLDGFGLLQALRSDPRTSAIPVIFISARAGEEATSEGMMAGADDYLVKPFAARELLARVAAHLKLAGSRRQAEQRAAGILESITDGFYAVDQNWRFIYVNATGERLLGMPREHLLGASIWVAFPPIVGTELETEFRRAVRDHTPVEFEYYYAQWGRWFDMRGFPAHGGGLSIYFRDITGQKETIEALRESDAKFRQLADAMPQIVWTARPDGFVDYFNERWYVFTGLDRGGPGGDGSWKPVLHPDDFEHCHQTWYRCVRTGEPYQNEYRLLDRASGRYRWFLGRALPIRNSAGAITKWFGSCTDIDEQRRAKESLIRSNEDLQEFAYAAAHDLQEPLRTVQIYTQLLARSLGQTIGPEETQFMRYITESARRMSDLICDLRDFLEVSEGDADALREIDLGRALEKAVKNLSSAIRRSGATISSQGLPTVPGKEVHFVQLFQNLLSNAVKYRSEKPPEIRVSAVCQTSVWYVSVSDNGLGIAPEYRERIFGLFKRLHGKEIPGTGMGLAICQKIAERYGGRIWVDSEPGAGSTFVFTLPVLS